jgi:hypothetical protein
MGSMIWIVTTASTSHGWWIQSHGLIAEAATRILPDEMPAFFRAAGKKIAHLAGDPDRWKNREAEFLKSTEFPEHFIDLEDWEGIEWPRERFRALEQLIRLNKQPEKVGLLPYALAEGFDKLTIAFADYRKDPTNEVVQQKCLIYAGILSHYTGDCCMPLHTTRDYDGRPGPHGTMVQKGIHAKIDGFPENQGFTAEEMARDLQPRVIRDVWGYIRARIMESHVHVDLCYELDKIDAFTRPTPASRAFILERVQAATEFTADLWLTAWRRSATLPPPY